MLRNLSPLDLNDSRVIFARSPAEEAIDLGVFAGWHVECRQKPTVDASGRWTTIPTIITKDAEGRIIAETLQRGE